MPKINSFFPINYSILFIISLIGLIVFFLLLEPKVSAFIFPWTRQVVLQNFEQSVRAKNRIDPQDFWKFREFYSPGVFEINKSGLMPSQVGNLSKVFNLKGNFLPVDKFSSGKIISLEALVESNNLYDYVDEPTGKVILNIQNEVIYQNGNNLFIEFVMPKSDMQKANGLFDYKEDDINLLKGKYWLSVNKINL